jgi:hypothetical protein
MLIISEDDYARLQAVVDAARAALEATRVMRGVGDNLTRQHVAYQALHAAVGEAKDVKALKLMSENVIAEYQMDDTLTIDRLLPILPDTDTLKAKPNDNANRRRTKRAKN